MAARRYDIQSQAYKRNPHPTLWEMIEAGPMVRIKIPMVGSYLAVTPHEAVSDLLRDRKRFVRDPRSAGLRMGDVLPWWFPRSMRPMANSMIIRDEPDHRRLRGLVEQAFLRRSIERMRDRLETVADEMLDDLEAEQKRSGKPVDLVSGLARPFPLAVICELLGLPQSDRPRFVRQAEFMTRISLWRLPGLYGAMTGMLTYIREQIRLRRAEPNDGLITELIAAEEQGDKLSEDELVSMVILLLFAGHVTTVHLIGGGIHTLLAHPEQKRALMADWSAAERAIDEMLRYLSPVQITKPMMPATDMEWRGQRLKRGEKIVAMLAAANADRAKFEHPERFDMNRDPNPHVAFGMGIHTCLGWKLAKVETEIALGRLFTRFSDLEATLPLDEAKWSRQLGTRGMEVLPVRLG